MKPGGGIRGGVSGETSPRPPARHPLSAIPSTFRAAVRRQGHGVPDGRRMEQGKKKEVERVRHGRLPPWTLMKGLTWVWARMPATAVITSGRPDSIRARPAVRRGSVKTTRTPPGGFQLIRSSSSGGWERRVSCCKSLKLTPRKGIHTPAGSFEVGLLSGYP